MWYLISGLAAAISLVLSAGKWDLWSAGWWGWSSSRGWHWQAWLGRIMISLIADWWNQQVWGTYLLLFTVWWVIPVWLGRLGLSHRLRDSLAVILSGLCLWPWYHDWQVIAVWWIVAWFSSWWQGGEQPGRLIRLQL